MISHAEALGTITDDMVRRRAVEIAKGDGRAEANAADREAALTDLMSTGNEAPVAPELDSPDVENITEWDTPPEAMGGKAPTVGADDDSSIAEELINEGLDEADHDQRYAAAEENPPEEA